MSQGGNKNNKNNEKSSKKANAAGCGCLTAIILVVFVLPVLWGLYDEGVFDGEDKAMETAPVFGPKDVGRLVERLSAASEAQGVCYGWVIDSGRSRTIPKVTPSYRGTFRPDPGPVPVRPRSTPTQAPRVPETRVPSPDARATDPRQAASPRPTVSRSPGAGRAASRPTPRPTPAETLSAYEREEIQQDLEELEEGGVEYGSNLGVGIDPRQAPDRCSKWAVLKADYIYSSRYQEWTSGRSEIETNLEELDDVTISAFREALGQGRWSGEDSDDINGEHAVARLADQIGALPLLVSNEGLAPPVPAPTEQSAAPPGDRLSESRFTARNVFIGIGIALIAGAVVWIAVAAVRNARSTSS